MPRPPSKIRKSTIGFAYVPRIGFNNLKDLYPNRYLLRINTASFIKDFFSYGESIDPNHSAFTYPPIVKISDRLTQWGLLYIPNLIDDSVTITAPAFYEKGIDNMSYPIMLVQFRIIEDEQDEKYKNHINQIYALSEYSLKEFGFRFIPPFYAHLISPDDIDAILKDGIGMVYHFIGDEKERKYAQVFTGKGIKKNIDIWSYYNSYVDRDTKYIFANSQVNKFIAFKFKQFERGGNLIQTLRYRVINTMQVAPTIGTNLYFNMILRTDQSDNKNYIYNSDSPIDLLFFNKMKHIATRATNIVADSERRVITAKIEVEALALTLSTQGKYFSIEYDKRLDEGNRHSPLLLLADNLYRAIEERIDKNIKETYGNMHIGINLMQINIDKIEIWGTPTRISFKLYIKWEIQEEFVNEIQKAKEIIKRAIESLPVSNELLFGIKES